MRHANELGEVQSLGMTRGEWGGRVDDRWLDATVAAGKRSIGIGVVVGWGGVEAGRVRAVSVPSCVPCIIYSAT